MSSAPTQLTTTPDQQDPRHEHFFCEAGYDLWGYDANGHYKTTFDRAPFTRPPFPTCQLCDDALPCPDA